MTLGKFVLCTLCAFMIASCSNNDGDDLIGDYGYHLHFEHVPAETLIAHDNIIQHACLPNYFQYYCVHLIVQSSLIDDPFGSNIPQHYYLEGIPFIEKQLAAFIDPDDAEYHGSMPVVVKYTTVECLDITIGLYNRDKNLVADITDETQFSLCYGEYSVNESASNIIINKDCQVIGKIEIGTTIKQYLEFHPMLFAEAVLMFPTLDENAFGNGNYVVVEIELANGTKLTASTDESYRRN